MNDDLNKPLERQAFLRAEFYEKSYHGCAQSVLAAIQDVLGLRWSGQSAFQAATGLSGGIGCLGETCGAFIGAVLGIGLCVGRERENFSDPRKIHWENYKLVKKLHQRFIAKYGAITCRGVQRAVFGKCFDFWDPKSFEEFGRLDGHAKCSEVTAQAAEWAIDILSSYQQQIHNSARSISPKKLNEYEGFILDLDGTLWLGGEPIPGALEVAKVLAKMKSGVVILTNNTALTRAEISRTLNESGLYIPEDRILTSAYITAKFLLKAYGKSLIYLIGNESFEKELTRLGHKIVAFDKANIVVIGYDPDLNYEKLYRGMQALQKGAILIASDLTPAWAGKSGILYPGSAAVVGSFAGMGFYPYAVVGKPSPIAVEMALEHLGLPKSKECLLIGDDLEVDIKAAFNAGIDSLLVFTGVTQLEDLSKSFIKPDYVASSMAQLPVEARD